MKNKILLIPLVLLLAITLVASGCPAPVPPAPAPPEVIKARFATWSSPGSIWGDGLTIFIDRVNEKLAGRFEVEWFAGSSLYTHEEALVPLRTGALDFWGDTSGDMMEKWNPVGGVYGIAAFWPDWATLLEYANSPAGKKVLAMIQETGNCYALPLLEGSGWHRLWFDRKIESMDDFKALRVITWAESQIHFTKAVGGASARVPVPECYSAIAGGMNNGMFCAIGSAHMFGLPEFTPYMATQPWVMNVGRIMVNKDYWDGLPEDIRKVITDEVCPETQAFFTKEITIGDEARLKAIVEKYKVTPYAISDKVWAEVIEICKREVWPIYKESLGEEMYNDALRAAGHL